MLPAGALIGPWTRPRSDLAAAGAAEATVLADCYGVDPADLADASLPVLKAAGRGEAAAQIIQLRDRVVTIAPAGDAPASFTSLPAVRWLRHLDWHLDLSAGRPPTPSAFTLVGAGTHSPLRVLADSDRDALDGLLADCGSADAGTVAPSGITMSLAVGCWFGPVLAAAGLLVDGGRGPLTAGLITHPDYRRRGVAGRVGQALLAAARPVTEWLQLRTRPDNTAAEHLAQALGFRPFAREHPARAEMNGGQSSA